MYNLAIETTAGICSCAILNNNELINLIHIKTNNQQQNLMPSIDKLYKNTKINKNETKLISVDIGPGAFTALRIGVATAKSLAHALNANIIGISALEALYKITNNLYPDKKNKIILIDARRKKLFTDVYLNNEKVINNLDLELKDILYYITDYDDVVFIGSGADKYINEINSFCDKKNVIFIDNDKSELNAEIIGKMGFEKFNDKGSDNLYEIVPLYIRNSDETTKGK